MASLVARDADFEGAPTVSVSVWTVGDTLGAPPVGLYRHYKGGYYTVFGLAQKQDVPGAPLLVLYLQHTTGEWFVRRMDDWSTPVRGVPRFESVYFVPQPSRPYTIPD